MSGHLAGQLIGRNHLGDVRFTNGFFTIGNGVIVIAATTDVIVGFRMLSGQVLPQSGLPGEFGVAPGAGNLGVGPRRGGRRRRRGRGAVVIGQPGLVPASMGRQIGRTGEPLVALGTTIFHVSDPGASMLRQLESVLVKLSAELTPVRPEPIFNFGQFGARLLRDLDDVEGWIDVAGHHRLVRAKDHGARHRAAGVLVEFKSPGVLLLRPRDSGFLVAGLLRGLRRGGARSGTRGRRNQILLANPPSGTLRR